MKPVDEEWYEREVKWHARVNKMLDEWEDLKKRVEKLEDLAMSIRTFG